MTVNPLDVTKFDRTESELQEFLLFCIAVAGKRSITVSEKLDLFLLPVRPYETPFEYIRWIDARNLLTTKLRAVRLSPYGQRTESFRAVAKWSSLKNTTVDELMQVPGIGPKTARFFVLHNRPDQQVAVLDTHILAFLRDLGWNAPRQTPSSPKTYANLEWVFLNIARDRGMTPAELDLQIWTERSQKSVDKG